MNALEGFDMNMNTYTSRRRKQAFSLIELLLVLVILAVLAAVVVPRFTNRSKEARITAAKSDIANISLALDMFETDNGRFPSSDETLQALQTQPQWAQDWKGPYLKDQPQIPKDPWGNPYVYRYPGTNNPTGYDLVSYGPDGREGGDDVSNLTK
jgi:general secretion pathway protein G